MPTANRGCCRPFDDDGLIYITCGPTRKHGSINTKQKHIEKENQIMGGKKINKTPNGMVI